MRDDDLFQSRYACSTLRLTQHFGSRRVLPALQGLALKSFLAFFTNQRGLRVFSDLCREQILFLTSSSSCSRAIHWSGRKIFEPLTSFSLNDLDGQFSPPALSGQIFFRWLGLAKYVGCLIIYSVLQKIQPFSQGVTIFQFAVYNIIQLRPTFIIYFPPSYWYFYAKAHKESLLFSEI